MELKTQREVAAIMTERGYPMGRSRVQEIEQSALKKMREHPLMRELMARLDLERRKD